jgi:hypothetical protein
MIEASTMNVLLWVVVLVIVLRVMLKEPSREDVDDRDDY